MRARFSKFAFLRDFLYILLGKLNKMSVSFFPRAKARPKEIHLIPDVPMQSNVIPLTHREKEHSLVI